MCLNAEKELEIRTALKTKVAAVPGTEIAGVTAGHNVFETPYFFANRQDFAATLGIDGVNAVRDVEIKFAQVHYLNFIDTARGTDECPELEVNYNITLYRQFIQIRGDAQGSRPYNDYVAWVMKTMRAFFVNRQITDEATIIRFEQPEPIAVKQESIYMPGELGIFTTLRAVLEVK